MIARPTYIAQLKPFINKHQIKILTGIRRSGKSTVLLLLKDELLASGVKEEQIISINFESFAYAHLLTATNLYQYIKNEVKTSGKFYLLLDEIQEVEDWEKAVNSFLVDFDVDIYLTGSNSHLLSSERLLSSRADMWRYPYIRYPTGNFWTSGKIIFPNSKTREISFCSTFAKADSR